jgi:hypothetical protein
MLKKIGLILILIFPVKLNSQNVSNELGLFAGVSYYMGDINPKKLFYAVEPAFGAIYKLNLNERYAIRFSGIFSSLHGSDADFNDGYQLTRGHSFQTTLSEIAVAVEYNFFPYKPESRYEFLSPYVVVGFGISVIPSVNNTIPIKPVIPFGIGVKYAFNKRLGVSLEWAYRKTFTDYLDQLADDEYSGIPSIDNKQRSYTATNDWYSFAGVSLTYKFAFGKTKCPAYRN